MAEVDTAGQSTGEGAQGGSGNDSNQQQVTGGTGESAQSGANDGQGKTPETVSRADFEQLKAQLSAADKRRNDAELKAKALEDAKLTDDEKLKRDFEAQKAEVEALRAELKNARLQKAFVTDNTFDWHNPQAALQLADLSNVEISEDGKTVKGLKEALKAVADANPWMVKPKSEGSGEQQAQGGATGVGGQGASGAGGANKTTVDALAKRFPQIKGRTS